MLSVLEVRQAELEKVNLEVETEVLYLNTTGLRKLAVWTGVREARVTGRGRVEVLRDIRSYVTRHTDGEDNIEVKIVFLTRMRDQIRDLMQEPDNWEQTPSHHRVMVTSPDSRSEPSARRRSPVRGGRPIPPPRRNMFAEFSTPAPQSRASSLVSDGRRRILPAVPDLSAVVQQSPLASQHSPLESIHNRASSHASSAQSRRSLQVTPGFSFNSIPPWNRGGQAGDNASLLASLARVEGDRQRAAAQANDSDNTQQLLSESGTEDGDHQGTFTIDGSEAEDNLRIQELQNEIEKLVLQRKRKNLSSRSTSSSGSSTQRAVQPKIPRTQNSGSSSNGSRSSRQSKLHNSSPHKDAPVPRRKALSGSSDEGRAAAPQGRKSSSRNDRRRKALSGSSDDSHDAPARRKSSRSDRPRSSVRRSIRRDSSSDSSTSSEGSSSSPGSPVVSSKKMSKSVSVRKLKASPRRKVGVSYPRSPLSDKRRKAGRHSPSRHRSRKKSVSFTDGNSAAKSVGTSVSGCTVGDLKDAWRREFKIKGQIGKIGDKENKLDFLSVKRQIENGLKKGHKEPEIIEAVVNCTTAGTTLRSFLQSSTDLTVEVLLDILRSYFQEADTVELLQQLSTARQDPKEDPQTFLITLLDLKNRIVRNEDQDIGFSPETVMKIMLKTLESGLSDDGILNSIRPFLSDPAVSDNVLIREMSHAVVLAKKRKEKSKAAARVSVVEESPEIAQLQSQLNELQKQQASGGESAQIAKLQATLNQLVNNQQKGKKPIYGCKQCKADGKGKTCSHCFVCGEEGHKVENCPKKKEKKEEEDTSNSNRSPARD